MFAAGKTSGASAGGGPADPQFNYVSMLLHGDGTNGAQNNTFLDSSTNNFTITRNGNTTQGSFSPYGSNWSNYFVKSASSYVSFPQSSAYSFGSGDFTIEGWLFVSGLGSVNCGFFRIGGAFALTLFNDQGQTNELCVFVDSPRLILQSNANISSDTWTYFAVSKSSGTYNFYINGTRVRQVSDSTSWTCSASVNIGTNINGNEFFPGYVSNLRVSNTALYTGSTLTVPTTPLTSSGSTVLLTCQSNRFLDNSSNAFTATASGTPSVQRFNPFGTATAYSTSVIGGSGYFDGSGDYLQIADSSAFTFGSNNFTVELWIYSSNTSLTLIIGQNNGNPSTTSFDIRYDGTTITGNIFSSGTNYAISESMSKNAWHHVAFVRNGTSLRIYVDGVSTSSTAVSTVSVNDSSNVLRIGASSETTPGYYFNGYMTDARIVKGTAVYTSNFTPPTAPLTAITNTQLLTNFINGAIFDNAMMANQETVGDAQISTSVVKFGTGSMKFDGNGDWLKAPNSPNYDMGAGDFTIEGWFYQTATGGQICCKYEASYQSSWAIGFDGSNWDVYTYYGSTSNLPIYTGVAGPSLNTWNHFALERNGSNIEFYLNGSRVAQVAAQTMRTTTSAVAIGNLGQGYSSFFEGYIDDLRITKGYARYSGATYTVPTAAFPNTGPN